MPAPSYPPLPNLEAYRLIRKLGSRPNGISAILELDDDASPAFAKMLPVGLILDNHREAWWARAARIHGPLCPVLVGAGTSADQLIVLRDFVKGEPLKAHLSARREFLPEDFLAFAAHVVRFLVQIHSAGLFHGRLKPSNIIIPPSLVPCITEIHVPYLRFRELSVTRTGFQVEHPSYLAPEHFDPEAPIDIRTDIFCLGAIAYRMLTGNPPFPGDTTAEIKLNILNLEPPRPSAAPASLASIIMKMLEKNPDRRHQSPQELLEELEKIRRARVAVLETPPPPEPRRKRMFPVLQPIYWKAGLAVCVLMIIIIIAIILSSRDDQPAISPLDPRLKATIRTPARTKRPKDHQQQTADPANAALQDAMRLADEQPAKAVDLLDRIIRDHSGTPAAAQAIQARATLAKTVAGTATTEKSRLEQQAKDLVSRDKFGEAVVLYARFLGDHRQDRNAADQTQLAIIALKAQADKRFAALKAEAEEHVAAKRYERAAMLYQLVRDNFGIERHVSAAAQRLAVLEPLVKTEREQRLAEQQSAQQRAFLQMILPAEQQARLWQFAQAAKECDRIAGITQEQRVLSQIADQKREYELLARLKNRLIETIKANAPIPLSALRSNRSEGEVVGADNRGITAQVSNARAQERWDFLTAETVEALIARSIRPNDAEDHAGAALLLLRLGREASAEREFTLADRLKGDLRLVRHSAPAEIRNLDNDEKSAEELIGRAQDAMLRKQWTDALASLETLVRRHPGTYALQTRKADVDQWLSTCRTGSKIETFDRDLKQGIAVDLLTGPPDGQWSSSGGTWSTTEDGVLHCENAGKQDVDRSIIIRYPPQYLLRSAVRVVSGPGLLVRVLVAEQAACDFMLDVENPKNVGLLIVQNRKVTRTITREVKLERGKWYDLRAAVRPAAITVYCGGTRFAADDFPSLRGAGQVSISLVVRQGSVAEFKDVVLQTLKHQ